MSFPIAALRPLNPPSKLSLSPLSPITTKLTNPLKTPNLQSHSTNIPGFLVTKRAVFSPNAVNKNGISIKPHKFQYPFTNFHGFIVPKRTGFVVKAANEEDEVIIDKAEEEARGQSTLPDRFRHLTKEAPNQPVRWPWFIAVGFLLYAWRTVLWELSNWKKVTATLVHLVGYLSKLALALIFHFIGDPITSLIQSLETMLYAARAFYSSVVSYTPVPELTLVIVLVSTVLAIAEASVPDSVESQPYLLSLAGVIGYAAVKGSISELFFWTLLFGLFSFARFVKKRDYVSSALPVAAVLAGMGEPWVRFVVMTLFLALAVTQHWTKKKKPVKDEDEDKVRKVPVPLLFAGMAIGVRVAAKWVGYRHLTWMVV